MLVSDVREIHRSIAQALTHHALAEAVHLDVELVDGEVTVRGVVDSRHEHDVVVAAVRTVAGVTHVIDKLHVEP
jgi:osmotically-inducible protein OsmY